MPKHWVLIAIVAILAIWIFHVHYNRGIPLTRGGGAK